LIFKAESVFLITCSMVIDGSDIFARHAAARVRGVRKFGKWEPNNADIRICRTSDVTREADPFAAP
jgi:hypothetical protein